MSELQKSAECHLLCPITQIALIGVRWGGGMSRWLSSINEVSICSVLGINIKGSISPKGLYPENWCHSHEFCIPTHILLRNVYINVTGKPKGELETAKSYHENTKHNKNVNYTFPYGTDVFLFQAHRKGYKTMYTHTVSITPPNLWGIACEANPVTAAITRVNLYWQIMRRLFWLCLTRWLESSIGKQLSGKQAARVLWSSPPPPPSPRLGNCVGNRYY